MEHEHYNAWVDRNKPAGMSLNDFKEFLGLIGAITVQKNLNESEQTMYEYITKFFNGEYTKQNEYPPM